MATQNDSAVNFIIQNSSSSFLDNTKPEGATTSSSTSSKSISHGFGIYDAATVIVGVFGILTNLLSGVVFVSHRPLRRGLANCFLMNQCLIDLLSGLFLVLSLITIVDQTTHKTDAAICYFWNAKTIYSSLHVASCFNLVALTFERYAKIVHPIRHKLRLTKQKIIVSIFLTWVIGLAFKFSTILSTTRFVNGSCVTGVTPSRAISILIWAVNLLMEYLLPILTIATCYILMARSFRRRVQTIPVPADNNSRDNNSSIRLNIFKTLLLVVVCMALCLLPRQCVSTVFTFKRPKLDANLFSSIYNDCLIIAYLNCSLNPLIYLFRHQQFRKGFRRIFCRCCPSKITAESYVQNKENSSTIVATAF